jgi:hypothetical protein
LVNNFKGEIMADDQVSSPIPGATVISDDGQVTKTPDAKDEKDMEKQVIDLPDSEPADFDAQAFESIKNLVTRKTVQADELKLKTKELQESLKNILVNDDELSQSEESLKENRKKVTERKSNLMGSPEAQSIKLKLQEAKEDLKDIEDSLSSQLLNLYQLTGVQEFETDEGEVREFVIKARVKAKRKK